MTSTITAETTAEGICAALARAEAAFDERGWIEMPKADRNRYLERALLAKTLIASAIRQAEDAAEQRAIDRARQIIATAIAADGADAEAMRRLLMAAFDPAWDRVSSIIKSPSPPKDQGHE